MLISAPASTANLGSGFDCLGLALDLKFNVHIDDPQHTGPPTATRHPAQIAFSENGGDGPIYVSTDIPPGKGFGFSGAARVAGTAAALIQRSGSTNFSELLEATTELEGHADNVAASIYGGLTVVSDGQVVRLSPHKKFQILMWVPDSGTSTVASRQKLPKQVSFNDASQAIGKATLMVAAMITGNKSALLQACRDQLHQPKRLESAPQSVTALANALENGASAAWLSGSGPSIAILAEPHLTEHLQSCMPESGHTKSVAISRYGLQVS
jgi:homoserine kinase